jgi:hypothetical protein
MSWIPIRYRDFYDYPRAFVVEHTGALFFFDCPFDERADDYPDHYRVYRLPPALGAALDAGSWSELASQGTLVADVPVARVTFDDTRRHAIDAGVLENLWTSGN